MTNPLPALPSSSRLLTAVKYQRLADVPPEIEWFANLANVGTRRAYEGIRSDQSLQACKLSQLIYKATADHDAIA